MSFTETPTRGDEFLRNVDVTALDSVYFLPRRLGLAAVKLTSAQPAFDQTLRLFGRPKYRFIVLLAKFGDVDRYAMDIW